MRYLFLLFTLLLSNFALAQTDNYKGERHRRGFKHGIGTYTFPNGSVYEGRWRFDKMDGEGTLIYQNGTRYKGEFAEGTISGYGSLNYPDGSSYTGSFIEGTFNGEGTFTNPNGTTYTGWWADGLAQGRGKQTFASGAVYQGLFRKGKPHGQGIMLYPDGKIEQGTFNEGEYIPCECPAETTPLADKLTESDVVVSGQVVAVEALDGYDFVTLQVSSHFKGPVYPDYQVSIIAEYSSCDVVFLQGEYYLVYGEITYENFIQTSKCKGSGTLAERVDELTALRDIACDNESLGNAVFYPQKDLVCGCDGQTYDSPYKAYKRGIQYWQAGACKE
jgi:hypothetical protein